MDGTARDNKLMWAFGNYSRFVRPAMVRVEASLDSHGNNFIADDNLMVSAFSSPDGKKLVVVVVNTTESAFFQWTRPLPAGKSQQRCISQIKNTIWSGLKYFPVDIRS
jgi:hypothetical protein